MDPEKRALIDQILEEARAMGANAAKPRRRRGGRKVPKGVYMRRKPAGDE